MKKQINPTIKAHLIRSAFYLLLLLAVCAIPFALAQRNTKRSVTKPNAAAKVAPPATGAISASGVPNISGSHIPRLERSDARERARRGEGLFRSHERRHGRQCRQDSANAAISAGSSLRPVRQRSQQRNRLRQSHR